MLAGAARSTCIIGLLDRPLFLALIVGSCTAEHSSLAFSLGIITELCWLDIIAMGSIVPPYASLSFLLAFPLCRHFELLCAGQVILPLLFALFAASLAAWFERYQRNTHNSLEDTAIQACQSGSVFAPGWVIMSVGWQRALGHVLLYSLCFSAIAGALTVLKACDAMLALEGVTWPTLYTLALLGAVLALRTRQACMILAGSLLFLGLCIWGGR